jgi:nicotinate-nucleotide--dimethylbenzimidazole phosphoribosyltransferase
LIFCFGQKILKSELYMTFNIKQVNPELKEQLQHKIDFKTKPTGALGQLEDIALQIGLIQETLSPKLVNPHMVVFAADHGIAAEGVSKYPSEVTRQMVLNFAQNGAAINVFCKQNSISLKVVDMGVKGGSLNNPLISSRRVGEGTKNFLHEPAMTSEQLAQCFKHGREVVEDIAKTGCNIIGFGEMGIGNTSSAAVLMHKFTGISIGYCVGKGTGLDETRVLAKKQILEKAAESHGIENDPLSILTTFGGFEIAAITSAILTAAECGMTVLIDGYIATAAFLAAHAIDPKVKEYSVFCHLSDEIGHRGMLDFLEVQPILRLNLRLGEGTGVALVYPIIQAAVAFLNDMASFESAGVSNV